MSVYELPLLPPASDIETKVVLKRLALAHRALAELKGMAETIPNEEILISTLTLQEAKHSSEIENIITTHDELYKNNIFENELKNPSAKEVSRYASALRAGFGKVRKTGLLTTNMIIALYQELEGNNGGIRSQPGTTLKNERTGEIIYTPPQDYRELSMFMDNLEQFINDESLSDIDPLVKMAIIHHQFESIHPFIDGNGRTGRIINILYLVSQGLLNIPVLYLSRYIINNKQEYYKLLQDVRNTGEWDEWILFMLDGVILTSADTIKLISEIKLLMQDYKHRMRTELPKIYSQELLNNIFSHPYTKIQFVESTLNVKRLTATKYLDQLVKHGFLSKHKLGRNNFYINDALFSLFMN